MGDISKRKDPYPDADYKDISISQNLWLSAKASGSYNPAPLDPKCRCQKQDAYQKVDPGGRMIVSARALTLGSWTPGAVRPKIQSLWLSAMASGSYNPASLDPKCKELKTKRFPKT
jgi:hypothetical protein